jgi:hypothetical protein
MVIALLASATAAAQIAIRPGQYEFTVAMKLAIPAEGQKAIMDAAGLNNPEKRLECITDDIKDAKGLVDLYARELGGENCKVSDVKTSGNKVTFALACQEDDVRMTGTTEVTFGTDAFTTFSTMKDGEGRVSTAKISAKRVGACPK